MKKWYAFVFLAFVVGGIAGIFAGAWLMLRANLAHAADNMAGEFSAWALPLHLMDKPPSDNLRAWKELWWSAEIKAEIAGMAYDRIGSQWRRELYKGVERLDRVTPMLVKAGIATGMKSQEMRQCILSGRSDPKADVETCVRKVYALYQYPPARTKPSEQAASELGPYWSKQHRKTGDRRPEKQAAALVDARNKIIAAALDWPELRPYYREPLVGVASYLERQSRQPDDYDGTFQDDKAFDAARQCILAAQLDMDSDVASCVKRADASEQAKQRESSSDKT